MARFACPHFESLRACRQGELRDYRSVWSCIHCEVMPLVMVGTSASQVESLRIRVMISIQRQLCVRLLTLLSVWGSVTLVVSTASAADQFQQIGVGSCAAAGCHGGDGTRKLADGAIDFSNASLSTWVQKDPHARAYEVLLNARSKQIIQKLGADWLPAHENRRCLVCHSPLEPESSDKLALAKNPQKLPRGQHEMLLDGVSCEACHGAAEKWMGPHTEHTWRDTKAAADRAALGFVDLRTNLVERAQACAKCHVGGPGRDVDHDLIAAGHPRLNFELSAYHANVPAHWNTAVDQRAFPVKDQPDGSALEAKLWIIGQLTAADAALTLLETRAQAAGNQNGPWPEFAEYGCFACHHDLQAPSWRQQRPAAGRRPGSYPWGTWGFALVPFTDRTQPKAPLSDALRELEKTMSAAAPDVTKVQTGTAVARKLIDQEMARVATAKTLTKDEIRGLLQSVVAAGPELSTRDWDAAAQVYLATVSLYQGSLLAEGKAVRLKLPNQSDREVISALEAMRDKLKFPQPPETVARFASPRTFDAQRIEVIHGQLKKIAELVKNP